MNERIDIFSWGLEKENNECDGLPSLEE